MKICVAGAYGAFGNKHLEALDAIEGVSVTSVMGPSLSKVEALAMHPPHCKTVLAEMMSTPLFWQRRRKCMQNKQSPVCAQVNRF